MRNDRIVNELNLESDIVYNGLTAFKNYVIVSLRDCENHFYNSEEKSICETNGNIEPLYSIATDYEER